MYIFIEFFCFDVVVIGGDMMFGLLGGERKRVNIVCEIFIDFVILLFDVCIVLEKESLRMKIKSGEVFIFDFGICLLKLILKVVFFKFTFFLLIFLINICFYVFLKLC